MDSILEFFEPANGFAVWIGNFIMVFVISYLIAWLFALVLGRIGGLTGEDHQLRVYFAWMIPLVLHMLLAGILLVLSTLHFKELDLPTGYTLFFLVPILIDFIFTQKLIRKIKDRVNRLEKRVKE
jgi:biotin transporter BioY